MRYGFFCAVVLTACLSLGATAQAAGALGLWLTEGGKSHVEIRDCDGKLCGTIVWLAEPLDENGKEKLDNKNPDEALRGRKILGLPLLSSFVPDDEANVWVDGKIYNPEDGEIYSCIMTLADDDTLEVRGYVGLPIFGKTQTWSRVKAP